MGVTLSIQAMLAGTVGKAKASVTSVDRQEIAAGALVCLLTYVVALYYTGGDQVGYEQAYRAVRGIDPVLGFNIYARFISTVEVVHFVLVYVASNFVIDKNLFFSLLNGVLAVISLRAMRTLGVNLFLALFVIFTNYYFYVFYFAAERLKIALIFFFLAVLAVSKTRRYCLYLLAMMSHVTVMLLLAGRILQKMVLLCRRSEGGLARSLAELAFFVICILLVLYVFGDYAWWKFSQYYEKADNSPRLALPILLYIGASLYYAEKKWDVLIDFIPILLAFTVLGGSRVNMFAYLVFLKYGLQYNRGINAGVLVTSLYFAYKSVLFLKLVFATGQAF